MVSSSIKTKINEFRWFNVNIYKFNKIFKPKEKGIYFNLGHNKFDRYLYLLCLFFESEGYNVYFQCNYNFLASWSTSYLSKNLNNSFLVFKKPVDSFISFYTSDEKARSKKGKFLSLEYFNKKSGFYIPMPMVNTFYVNKILQKKIVKKKFQIKLFFAGNFDKDHYSDPILETKFNLPTRIELRNWLYSLEGVRVFENWNEIEKNELTDTVLIVDRKVANISPEDLPSFLISSDFFLAFPGVVMPMCHNIIEAMALGCIPVLNYNDYFYPNLVHLKNCLVFKNREEFKQIIHWLAEIDKEKIDEMRLNVIDYYNKYLSQRCVVQNILNTNENKIYLNAEYNSVKLIRGLY